MDDVGGKIQLVKVKYCNDSTRGIGERLKEAV